MASHQNYELHCPRCKKTAYVAVSSFFAEYSIVRLDLTLFLCFQCRTIYIDKQRIQRIISAWRKGWRATKKMPFRLLYREFLGKLEERIDAHYIADLGYRRTRFLKNPLAKQNP